MLDIFSWIRSLINFILSVSAGHCGIHSLLAVFWLHNPDGFILLAPDRNNRLLRSLHVHTQNICRCQNRLSCNPTSVCYLFFLYSFLLFYLPVWRTSTETSECTFVAVSWSRLCAASPPDWRRKHTVGLCPEKSANRSVAPPLKQISLLWILESSFLFFFFFFNYYLILTFLLHTSHGPKYVILLFTCLFLFVFLSLE